MATDRLKPGDVIGSALEIYGAQVWVLIPSAAVVFAVSGVAQLALSRRALPLLALVGFVLALFYQGMVAELVRDAQDGRRDNSAWHLFTSVAPMLLSLLGLSILYALGVGLGLILLIVPGLYLLTIWVVATPSLVIERLGTLDALGRSRALVRGHGWQVFRVILVVAVVQIIVGVLSNVIGTGLSAAGLAVVQWAAAVIVSPFAALVTAVLYFSLRRLHDEAATPTGELSD
jgi:uncharacterized membrane protein